MDHTNACENWERYEKAMGADHYHFGVKSSVFPVDCDCWCHGPTRRAGP